MPEFRNKIMEKHKKAWDILANTQKAECFSPSKEKMQKEIENFQGIYENHMLDEFLEKPICGKCGKPALQRCSKCKNEWYCGRECQIKAWSAHKEVCAILSKNVPTTYKKEATPKQLIQEVHHK